MSETNAADTVVETVVDSTQAENQPAGDSSPKTFTEQEVDAKIKARIDKQNAKHAEETAKLNARVEELEKQSAQAQAERDALKHQSEIAQMAQTLAQEKGVPANLLHGETQEELTQSAEALAAYKAEILASVGTAPVITDSGENKKPPKDAKAIFAQFMDDNFKN